MKKKIMVVLFILLACVGCKKEQVTEEMEDKRETVIQNAVGKTTDSRVVVKYGNGSEYYVYEIEEKSFIQYDYLFYDTEEDYLEAKEKYAENTYYQFTPYDDLWGIKITLQKGVGETKKEIRESLISKYTSDKNYEIIK